MYIVLIGATVLALASPISAQEQKASVYKVELTIKDDAADKPQPNRHYSMLMEESRKAVFQAGSQVSNECGSPQLLDTGAKIELTLRPSGDKLAIDGSIDLTSVTGHVNLSAICEPIIGEQKIVFNTTLELGKPATMSGDPSAPKMPQVEAVVTKVN